MFESTVCRRLVAVVLLIAGLVVLPAAPALAADEGEAQASQGEDSGMIQEVIDWLVELLGPEETGDAGPAIDPIGRA